MTTPGTEFDAAEAAALETDHIGQESGIEEFTLDLDDMCILTGHIASGIEYTGKLVALMSMAEPEFETPEWEEWNELLREAAKHREATLRAATRWSAIHDAQHAGKRVSVVVIPF